MEKPKATPNDLLWTRLLSTYWQMGYEDYCNGCNSEFAYVQTEHGGECANEYAAGFASAQKDYPRTENESA